MKKQCIEEAEKIEAYVNGMMRMCPRCESEFIENEDTYNEIAGRYVCPICGNVSLAHYVDKLDLEYYLENGCDDIEFRLNRDKSYRSASLLTVSNYVYKEVDTGKGAIICSSGTDSYEYPLSYEITSEIDECVQNLYAL